MKIHPAEQEKTTAKTKSGVRRTHATSVRPPRQAASKGSSQKTFEGSPRGTTKGHLGEAEIETAVEVQATTQTPLVPSPVFVRRDITGPDGSVRPGWEMWIGDHCFGRADSKELLLASFQRLQSPPESFHWREVRNRMQMRGRPRTVQPEGDRGADEPWGWEKKAEEPILVEEGAEGFQELSWENPA